MFPLTYPRALHTPCHTQDSICFHAHDRSTHQMGVFTGYVSDRRAAEQLWKLVFRTAIHYSEVAVVASSKARRMKCMPHSPISRHCPMRLPCMTATSILREASPLPYLCVSLPQTSYCSWVDPGRSRMFWYCSSRTTGVVVSGHHR